MLSLITNRPLLDPRIELQDLRDQRLLFLSLDRVVLAKLSDCLLNVIGVVNLELKQAVCQFYVKNMKIFFEVLLVP